MATPRLAKLQLQGADGLPLHVDVRSGARPGEKRPAVLIAHGFKGFKDFGFFPPLASRLAVGGFMAVSFNFSGSGVSDGDTFDEPDRWFHQAPTNDLRDFMTVADYAAAEGSGWLGLVGHSRGGALAILHAARDARVKSLVTWAAIDHFLRWPDEDIARWRKEGTIDVVNTRTKQVLTIGRDALDDLDAHGAELDVIAAAGRLTIPWLIIHGTADPTVPVPIAHRLAAASGNKRTEMMLVDGADHVFGTRHPWPGSNPDFDRVLERTVAHLASAL